MRVVAWTDRDGLKHRSLVRDTDPDTAAPHGILADPPDLGRLDWEAVRREIHNEFVDLGVTTWADLQQQQAPLRGIILGAMQRRVIALFREKPED